MIKLKSLLHRIFKGMYLEAYLRCSKYAHNIYLTLFKSNEKKLFWSKILIKFMILKALFKIILSI